MITWARRRRPPAARGRRPCWKIARGAGDLSGQERLYHQRQRRGFYYFPDLDRVALMEIYHELARSTPETGCRTLDILHVACACHLGPTWFGSYDNRQRALADKAGLPLFPRF